MYRSVRPRTLTLIAIMAANDGQPHKGAQFDT
jgi:hypothetical protein